jgi:[ribosomal protein S5]-alanine N-acetyltransferase
MSAVLSRDTSELIGKCGLAVLQDGRIEIGYRIRRDRWGSGYATEASRAWLSPRISHARPHTNRRDDGPENYPSIRVAEKIGMHVAGPEVYHDIPVIAYVAARA